MKQISLKKCIMLAEQVHIEATKAAGVFNKAKQQQVNLDVELCLHYFDQLDELKTNLFESIKNKDRTQAALLIKMSWTAYAHIAKHLNQFAVAQPLFVPKKQDKPAARIYTPNQ